MKIQSPASALSSKQVAQTQDRMNQLFDKISSGARITKAADDAAAPRYFGAMESQISALRVSRQNANEADSLLQVADSGAEQASDILGGCESSPYRRRTAPAPTLTVPRRRSSLRGCRASSTTSPRPRNLMTERSSTADRPLRSRWAQRASRLRSRPRRV